MAVWPKKAAQPGAADLELLLFRVPLGKQRQIVAQGKVFEGFRDPFDHLHGAFENPLGEPHHDAEVFLAHLALGQVLVALPQIAGEVGRAVTVDLVVGFLDLVQDVAHLARRHRGMVQEPGELVEGALEVDVVLPQRIVRVDEQEVAHGQRYRPEGPPPKPLVGARCFTCSMRRWRGMYSAR